ncbi:hypothetical protein VPH35_107440 [Triticum aestivum]
MLADTTAIYALGHLSVVVTSPEHGLMALWASLLLVHLGGQDNITAYAIEDNRLWLRHLQTFGVQLLAAGYVLYASSILLHPSLLCSAAILMSVVGVLKYGERVWALIGANSCASSSLSISGYMDFGGEQASGVPADYPEYTLPEVKVLDMAHSLLDIPKKMFEGPTSYVKIGNEKSYEANFMLKVAEMQLTMMYDLLYTKAAVVHTWSGFIVRLISLPFTVAALQVFYALKDQDVYRRADVNVTKVLLIGAVVLEALSVLRFMFSMWTAALLAVRKIGGSKEIYWSGWSGRMRQHNLFVVSQNTKHRIGSRIAKRMGLEDLWDSTFYSWSTRVPTSIILKVSKLVSTTEAGQVVPLFGDTGTVDARQVDIQESRGRNALIRRHSRSLWLELKWSVRLDLDEGILVWHIATAVYLDWIKRNDSSVTRKMRKLLEGTEALCNYLFFLLVTRPYMPPYPVTRQRYVQLCYDCNTQLSKGLFAHDLLGAILEQKDALIRGSPIQPNGDGGITWGRRNSSVSRRGGTARLPINNTGVRGTAQPPVNNTGVPGTARPSINSTLDRGCKLAAQLLNTEEGGVAAVDILKMMFEVWVEMLCYTAYNCNEKSHAKNLTNGGELMTIVALMMVYTSNGFIKTRNTRDATGTRYRYRDSTRPL